MATQALVSSSSLTASADAASRQILAAARSSFSSTRKVSFVTRAASTPPVKQGGDRQLWFASKQSLSYLDGTLPGDFGFDPLGLSDPEGTGGFIEPKWLAYGEVINGRFAMLGAVGSIAPEILGKAGADELFSDGKLVPLQLSATRQEMTSENAIGQVTSPKIRLRNEISPNDPYLFSPRAPTCSSRWKELLGLKRFNQNGSKQPEHQKTTPPNTGHKSLKVFLRLSPKSSVLPQPDSSMNIPLIHEADSESIAVSSSRLSLSSSCSSSGHDHDDFPRFSLDSEKLNYRRSSKVIHHSRHQGVSKERILLSSENPESIRTGRNSLRKDQELIVHDVSVDSPRMNSSGKIVFQSLERSSSSPSSLNGGPRYKYRGMERRSNSANVRYTPVLNVPVCSLRGSSSKSAGVFGFPLFSQSLQKKDGGGSVSSAIGSGAAIKGQHINRKNRSDRA